MLIPCEVKTTFDRSQPLDAHVARRLTTALHPYARHVERVEVRLTDANGPRVCPRDKVAMVEITLKHSGSIVAKATASDVYASVSRAADRARSALSRHVGRLIGRGRRSSRAADEGVA
jgi:ribosome-associated translation inhibitor RaiA